MMSTYSLRDNTGAISFNVCKRCESIYFGNVKIETEISVFVEMAVFNCLEKNICD